MNEVQKVLDDAIKQMARREANIEDAFIIAQMESLGITVKDLKNYTLVSQSDDGMISRRYFLKHKNDNWSNSEQTWKQDHDRAEQLNDALRRAGEFLVKNVPNRDEAYTVDGWKSYFLNEARFEEHGGYTNTWYQTTPDWYDRATIKKTDPKNISLWSAIRMKLYIRPHFIFDKEITVTYKVIGNNVYVLEVDNEKKS